MADLRLAVRQPSVVNSSWRRNAFSRNVFSGTAEIISTSATVVLTEEWSLINDLTLALAVGSNKDSPDFQREPRPQIIGSGVSGTPIHRRYGLYGVPDRSRPFTIRVGGDCAMVGETILWVARSKSAVKTS